MSWFVEKDKSDDTTIVFRFCSMQRLQASRDPRCSMATLNSTSCLGRTNSGYGLLEQSWVYLSIKAVTVCEC
jgi:hypothetical protein